MGLLETPPSGLPKPQLSRLEQSTSEIDNADDLKASSVMTVSLITTQFGTPWKSSIPPDFKNLLPQWNPYGEGGASVAIVKTLRNLYF